MKSAILTLLLAAASPAVADTPGVALPSIAGALTFDRNNTFGWRFTPQRDIDVSALGYFDATTLPSGSGAGLFEAHDVGVFRVSDQSLVGMVTVPAGTAAVLSDHFRYVTLPTPLHLSANTTYLIAGFYRSTSPDGGAAAADWVFPPEIVYANAPTPTHSNPTSGTSVYFVSATGSPPSALSYPPLAEGGFLPTFFANFQFAGCYANCDGSTGAPVLNVNDFICFQGRFAAGDSYANCDGSTTPPILNVNDFVCFQTRFVAGCP